MIDFKELPEDGVKFEQLIREILVLEGFETHWTGVGQDGGRDLIIIERLEGILSTYERKWLISCKHTANSEKSIGREQAGNISEDCKAIGADGYILVCSTQPTSSLVTRLSEIQQSQNIITRFWDSIEIEKRLSKPNTFGLIHTFFPVSSKNYLWKIYNAFSPSLWAANYKDYFLYLSCRHSNKYPYLESVEIIARIIEEVPIYKDEKWGFDSHYLRLRGVYYDDKHCTHIGYFDYIYPKKSEKYVINPSLLNQILFKLFTAEDNKVMNVPDWDVLYLEESTLSDSFQLDHKRFYENHIKKFENGGSRRKFLHDMAYQYEEIQKLKSK